MNIKNNFFKLTTIGLLTITGILTTKCTYQQQDNLTKKSKIEIVGRTGTTTRFKDIYDKNYTLVERIVDDSTAEIEESYKNKNIEYHSKFKYNPTTNKIYSFENSKTINNPEKNYIDIEQFRPSIQSKDYMLDLKRKIKNIKKLEKQYDRRFVNLLELNLEDPIR